MRKLADLRNVVALSARHKIEHAPGDSQRNWLAKLCGERGPFAAVQLAGAFIMRSQEKPN